MPDVKIGERLSADRSCSRCEVQGAPPRSRKEPRRGWLKTLAVIPAALLPLLPSFTCPACLAAYAGALSALGLGFMLNESVLLPLIVVALVMGIATVAWTTRSHRRPGPLVVTVAGSVAVVSGRLIWNVPMVVYGGGALLIAGAAWNLWLKRPRRLPVTQPQTVTNQ